MITFDCNAESSGQFKLIRRHFSLTALSFNTAEAKEMIVSRDSVNGVTIDITADQFGNVYEKIIVKRDSP